MLSYQEHILWVGALLFLIGIVATKASNRFGIPTLLLFLVVGILFGEGGFGLRFSSPDLMQLIGIIALNIILFSGGMDTKYLDIKPVMAQGVILATAGVLLTMLFTGVFIYYLTNNLFHSITFTFLESLLLASVMSSTDSASVFSILNSRGLFLKERLKPLLELESGSNDPMAYVLTILFIQFIQLNNASGWNFVFIFISQFVIGIILGFVLGILAVRFINRINLHNASFYPIILICIIFIVYAIAKYLYGNGFLAVYICGLVLGNAKIVHKYSGKKFLDGITWLCQGIMFLALGLLVTPSALLQVVGIGLIVSLFLILISRPAAVFLCLLPFRRMSKKAKVYVSWVGLRGAVPIIFATYPLTAHLDSASMIFNIVFFATLVSLLVQGTTVSVVAKWLGLARTTELHTKLSEFEIEMSGDIKSTMTEVVIVPSLIEKSNKVMDLPLPDKTLVVLIKRGESYFVPKGATKLEANDVILLISENDESMQEAYNKLAKHADDVKIGKNRKHWDRILSRWL